MKPAEGWRLKIESLKDETEIKFDIEYYAKKPTGNFALSAHSISARYFFYWLCPKAEYKI